MLFMQGDLMVCERNGMEKVYDLAERCLPSIRCVGYCQAWAHLDGEIDRAALRETGIAATRQLAKRQLTWLRGMAERIIIDCLARDAAQQALMMIEAELAAKRHPCEVR